MSRIKLNHCDPIIPSDLVGEKIINNDDKWVSIISFTNGIYLIREMYCHPQFVSEQELIKLIKTKYMSSDKKIIGYKLVKPEYHDLAEQIMQGKFGLVVDGCDVFYETFIKNLKQAGVLDLWFEPVYETPQIPKGSDAEKFVEMVEEIQSYEIEHSCGKIIFRFDKSVICFNKNGTFSHIYTNP